MLLSSKQLLFLLRQVPVRLQIWWMVDVNLEEGLTQGTSTDAAQSFSCINCDNDNRVCQQCILGLAKSQADQGFQSVFCPCGDELSLEALEPLLPFDLYTQLSTPRAPSRPVSINESFQ